jgi:hypothetical protein
MLWFGKWEPTKWTVPHESRYVTRGVKKVRLAVAKKALEKAKRACPHVEYRLKVVSE